MFMFRFEATRRVINLDHLVMAEQVDAATKRTIITMLPGLQFGTDHDDADRLFRQLDSLAADPNPEPQTVVLMPTSRTDERRAGI